jgi:hypothetical protein
MLSEGQCTNRIRILVSAGSLIGTGGVVNIDRPRPNNFGDSAGLALVPAFGGASREVWVDHQAALAGALGLSDAEVTRWMQEPNDPPRPLNLAQRWSPDSLIGSHDDALS